MKDSLSTPYLQLLDALTNVARKSGEIEIAPGVVLKDVVVADVRGVSAVTFAILDLSKELAGLVEAVPEFANINKLRICYPGGRSALHTMQSDQVLCRLAIERSPKEAADWLFKVVNTSSASGVVIQSIWGLELGAEIQLTPRIKIVNLEALPDSSQKRLVLQDRWPVGIISAPFDFESPNAAIVCEWDVDPFLENSDDNRPDLDSLFFDTLNLLRELTCLFTLFELQQCLPSAAWFNYLDPDLERARMGGGWYSTALEVVPGHLRRCTPVDAVEVKTVVDAYLELNVETRNRVNVAVQRLNLSLRRNFIGDKAAELAIAFESLLCDNSKDEVSFKVRMRCAKLLGGDAGSRLVTHDLVKQTYAMRSELVHTGKCTDKKRDISGVKTEPSEILAQSSVLCARMIKGIILNGIPDWSHHDII